MKPIDANCTTVSISTAITIIALSLAFSTWIRTAIGVSISVVYASVEDWLGWRNKKSNYNSTALKRKQVAKFKELETRATARRLTEIHTRTRTISPAGNKPESDSSWSFGKFTNDRVMGRFKRRKGGENDDDRV